MNKNETGRSMVEMLGVLAIIGVLSCVAVWGIRLSFNKNKANRLLNDVGVGQQVLAERKEREGEVALNFNPESAYELSGIMLTRADERADFIKAKKVSKGVCNILDKMQGDKFFIYESKDEGKSLIKMAECKEDNDIYFSYQNYGDEVGGCYPDCGMNAHCINLYECECDTGYEYDEETDSCLGEDCGATAQAPIFYETKGCCERWLYTWNEGELKCSCGESKYWDGEKCITCTPTEPSEATLQECCEAHEWLWQNGVCSCPEGLEWDDDAKECSSLFCIYRFHAMETGDIVGADCAYTFTEGTYNAGAYHADCAYTFTETAGVISIQKVNSMKCPDDEYCDVGWSNSSCSTTIPSGYLNGPTKLYGRCMKFSMNFDECRRTNINGGATMERVVGCQNADEYCSIAWKNGSCTNVSDKETDSTLLYGRCVPFTNNNNNLQCPITGGIQ